MSCVEAHVGARYTCEVPNGSVLVVSNAVVWRPLMEEG